MKLTSLSAKTNEEKKRYLWTLSAIVIVIIDFLVFFRAEGTGDIREHFIYWIDNVYQYYTNMVFARDSLKTQICILHFPPF